MLFKEKKEKKSDCANKSKRKNADHSYKHLCF